jgi:hypothetical protein
MDRCSSNLVKLVLPQCGQWFINVCSFLQTLALSSWTLLPVIDSYNIMLHNSTKQVQRVYIFNKLRKKCAHLSEPARSTRFSLANLRLVVESFSHLLSITQVNTLCERLLSRFIFVAATFLFKEPYREQAITLKQTCVQNKGREFEQITNKDCNLSQKLQNIAHSLNLKFWKIFYIDTLLDILSQLQAEKWHT